MTFRSLAAALSFTVALAIPVTGALAQDATTFAEAIGAPKPIESYPKPWPLANLVTPGKLTIGTTGASPPRTFVDPATGKLTGSYVDLFTKIATDLGLEAEFVKIEWPGILPGLAAGRFDMACDGASMTTARLASKDFLMTAPTGVNATVGLALKSSGIKDFKSAKSIGGVRGEVYFEGAKKALPGVAATEFPGLPESMMGLQNGQVELIAMNLSNALNALQSAPNKEELVLIGPALEVFAQALCVNAKEPDLLVATNLLLGNYRADGTLKAIIGKYATSTAEVDMLDKIGY